MARIVLETHGLWPNVVTCLGSTSSSEISSNVDSDVNPPMGFIYEAINRAKNQIKENFNDL